MAPCIILFASTRSRSRRAQKCGVWLNIFLCVAHAVVCLEFDSVFSYDRDSNLNLAFQCASLAAALLCAFGAWATWRNKVGALQPFVYLLATCVVVQITIIVFMAGGGLRYQTDDMAKISADLCAVPHPSTLEIPCFCQCPVACSVLDAPAQPPFIPGGVTPVPVPEPEPVPEAGCPTAVYSAKIPQISTTCCGGNGCTPLPVTCSQGCQQFYLPFYAACSATKMAASSQIAAFEQLNDLCEAAASGIVPADPCALSLPGNLAGLELCCTGGDCTFAPPSTCTAKCRAFYLPFHQKCSGEMVPARFLPPGLLLSPNYDSLPHAHRIRECHSRLTAFPTPRAPACPARPRAPPQQR